MKKILIMILFSVVIFSCLSCNKESIKESQVNDSSKQQLQIFKTDMNLSQEQVLSQIKAERLIENNGYLDNDEVVVMVVLDDDAVIDIYNDKYFDHVDSVASFTTTTQGQRSIKYITEKQDELIKNLTENKLIDSVLYQYNTIMNAVAVKTTYKKFLEIEKMNGIDQVVLSETYNRPKTTDDSNSTAVENVVEVYETGIFDSSSVEFTGNGTAVAVLDSGFDCSHSVFANQPSKELLTQKNIASVLSETNAKSTTRNLELFDVYYSKKIPFVYDYADKDSDVFPYDSEHGTHVAGIIGGKDNKITGVAVDTQLVLMKVFPDLSSGGRTEDILAALEDAVLLGVDAINMSLGSSCGFAREIDEVHINEVYDKLSESGISVLAAASNSYSSSFGGEQGNMNMVTNPDSGTVGAPSTYEACLSVASISGVKSRYMKGNGSQVLFFKESNSLTGDENNFVNELLEAGHINAIGETTLEYVTVPGSGLKVNYSSIDVKGKIALVRRGKNTFEEKAAIAKSYGAIACIIYNNIDGDIIMSMGKSDHIPTISISKDDGEILAKKDNGTLTLSTEFQAGPFMSDFSSWGPTPSLGLKPEITAHGGTITSSIPGGGYDELSGTSMATPNLCGIVVLIRQYLKEKYPTYTHKEISVLTNQLLMSTATIVLNEQGNPYSPRKQGAGLASLYNAVNTQAYLTVDGIEKPKLELLDDKNRTGKYEMEFNVVNITNKELNYNLSLVGMTESVSTSDEDHVAEKSQILKGDKTFTVTNGGTLNGDVLTVKAGETAKVKVIYQLSNKDKNMIDDLFPYGMYVEGFVKLENLSSDDEKGIDLNIPFLAFYGDWTEAPMFDKTYYEVESEAHNNAIDDEDKLKADYYATTPYGSYYYNYVIPLGTYLYDVDLDKYDAIPASKDKIAISNVLGTIDGLSSVYAGLLRNARTMTFTIVDKFTGEVIYENVDYNARKAYSEGGTPIPYYEFLDLMSYELGLVNNREYEFSMKALLDYGDGGVYNNVRNTFSFDFTMDDEAPILRDVYYEKEYDKVAKKDRYYITMTVYDNHYAQSITPLIFTSDSSYAILEENPIPIYSEKGKDTIVRFEITNYLEDIYADEIITNALAFSIDDYALNSNIYLCQLPGTNGEFKFTKDGTMEGTDMLILSLEEDEVVDVTKYLATTDKTLDENRDYLKYLSWISSDESIVKVKDGIILGVKPGRANITCYEGLDGRQAILMINVKAKKDKPKERKNAIKQEDQFASDATINSIRFSYFDTLFAYSRAAQTSEIGSTGSRIFLNGASNISFYPGEKIKLAYDFDPWYAEPNYELTYKSMDPSIAKVEEDGTVTALKEGTTTIVLSVGGSNLMARIKIVVKSEFVIENRMLVAYKGLGGDVVIPDDEGILYIGAYAFCLYDTDNSIELDEEDYDANKIPAMNTSIKSITIPDGVEEIQKYAFYNCTGLQSVSIPSSVRFIREYAFYNDVRLESVNLANIEVIGHYAFKGCEKLKVAKLDKAYSLGRRAFEGCTSLEAVDLTALRNTGAEVFKDCTGLQSVVLTENTKLSYGMFVKSGLRKVDIYEKVQIPEFCFANCKDLTEVTINNDIVQIGHGAFSECSSLQDISFNANVEIIGEQAFYGCSSLEEVSLPNNDITLGNYVFYKCENLKVVNFLENTKIVEVKGSVFQDTAITSFVVDSKNTYYSVSDKGMLENKKGDTLVFALTGIEYKDYVLDEKYLYVGDAAFTGIGLESLTITNPNTKLGDYAFANCSNLTTVNLPSDSKVVIGNHTFNYSTSLNQVNNLEFVKTVGDYAFANSKLQTANISEDATYGEGAFYKSSITVVTIGKNTSFGLGAFQNCLNLTTVNMPEEGNVHFGVACFAYDAMLAKIDLSKIGDVVEDQTFYGCSSLKSADLVNVKIIGEYAFSDCSTLSYVNIPVVEEIKSGAFSRYDEYKSAATFSAINLPNTLTKIGEGAFLGCEGLLEITIPEKVEVIDNYTFSYCLHLGKVTLPAGLKSIGEYAFAGCAELVNINLDNVEEFKDYAFTSDVMLTTVNLDNAKTIGYGSFASTALTGELTVPNLLKVGDFGFQNTLLTKVSAPLLAYIGNSAFEGNKNLVDFALSTELEFIGYAAFDLCPKLEALYFNDSLGEKVTTGTINDYALIDNGLLYVTLPNGHLQLNTIPGGLNVDTIEVLEDTYRIESFAGSRNQFIKKIVLPDTLKIIGNYAFYQYNALETVEFKSIKAPLLEDSYDRNAVLEENDPGYEKLHQHFDMFGYELYYYNFIDLVGKKKSITMILPANKDVSGYDSLVYEVYFGTVADAQRSSYVAMEQNLVNFIEYASKVMEIQVVTLDHETIINTALRYLNLVQQDITNYGYTSSEWDEMVNKVTTSKSELSALKLSYSSKTVKDLQNRINNLNTTFDISRLEELKELTQAINALTTDEKRLLDLTNYNALIDNYNLYCNNLNEEMTNVKNAVENTFAYINILVASLSALALAIFAGKKYF